MSNTGGVLRNTPKQGLRLQPSVGALDRHLRGRACVRQHQPTSASDVPTQVDGHLGTRELGTRDMLCPCRHGGSDEALLGLAQLVTEYVEFLPLVPKQTTVLVAQLAHPCVVILDPDGW